MRRTAIAWTTAGSVAAVIEMVRAGTLAAQGFLKQEHIPLAAFLATPTGQLFTHVRGPRTEVGGAGSAELTPWASGSTLV